jgi:hypothetical protein
LCSDKEVKIRPGLDNNFLPGHWRPRLQTWFSLPLPGWISGNNTPLLSYILACNFCNRLQHSPDGVRRWWSFFEFSIALGSFHLSPRKASQHLFLRAFLDSPLSYRPHDWNARCHVFTFGLLLSSTLMPFAMASLLAPLSNGGSKSTDDQLNVCPFGAG